MRALLKFFIRVSAFVAKEIREVIRQPRLVLSLILGPFLILALFGVGYRSEAPVLRSVIVAPADPTIMQQVEQYAATLGKQLQVTAVLSDTQVAQLLTSLDPALTPQRHSVATTLLASSQSDMVAAFPPNAAQLIEGGQSAPLVLYYNTADPVRDQYVGWFGRVYTDEINRRVLVSVAQQTQGSTASLQEELGNVRAATQETRAALQAGDQARASQSAQQLDQSTDRLTSAVAAGVGLLAGVQSNVGGPGASEASSALTAAQRLQRNTGALSDNLSSSSGGTSATSQQRLDELTQIERDTTQLEGLLAKFKRIPPQVLASPFQSKAENVAAIPPNFVTYYGPGVLALLLQHLAVTIAALSLVRERLLGAIEVFRVAPLSAFEALLGKYLSYILFCLVVAVVLVGLLVFGLGIPLQAATWPPTPLHLLYVGATLLALIVASLGIGFVISAVSKTDSQAVQLSMIVLLASIFFSGFFLSLDALYGPARIVAYALPVTYAIRALQALMLRGEQPALPDVSMLANWQTNSLTVPLLALALGSLVLFILANSLFARSFKGV